VRELDVCWVDEDFKLVIHSPRSFLHDHILVTNSQLEHSLRNETILSRSLHFLLGLLALVQGSTGPHAGGEEDEVVVLCVNVTIKHDLAHIQVLLRLPV